MISKYRRKKIAVGRKRRFLPALGLILFLTLVFAFGNRCFAGETAPRHLYLAVDAVPYRIFVEAQQKGLFKDFSPPSKLISVFPSLSNYAWSVILNTEKLESYQAKYYHLGFNKAVGRTLYEVGKPAYPNKLDYSDDKVLINVLAYITSGSFIKSEMKNLSQKVLASSEPRLFFGFIGISDIIAHMKGAAGLHKLLRAIDQELIVLRKKHLEKFKEPLAVTIISDHGNTLVSGKIIDFGKALKENNFRLTKKIKGPNDVVFQNTGILSVAPFFIQDARKVELAHVLAAQPWADVVVTIDNERGVFLVISQKGTLSFEYNEEMNEFRITEVTGEDPLGLVEQGLLPGQWIPQSEVFEASVKTLYPDSLMRIQAGLTQNSVNYPASVLVSLKRGFESGSKFMKFLAKFKGRSGTHGGLAACESLGVISSTDFSFPEWVPAYEVHKLIPGYDFKKRFEAVTLIWKEGGKCLMRFGQPLLDLPGVASVEFKVQTFDYQKHEFSSSYDLYRVKIPEGMDNGFSHGKARYYDVTLPKLLKAEEVYQIQTKVLDASHRAVAELRTKRIQIMPFKGYSTFPIIKYRDTILNSN